jgi:hypothetical protein
MIKNFYSKRIITILSLVLAVASQILVAQAQTVATNKTGRNLVIEDETKQKTQTAFMMDGTVNPAPGNPTCKDLSPFYLELKIDPPQSGNYAFGSSNSVSANFYGGEDGLTYFDFQSTSPFVAVIVKGGNQGANVYSYNSGQITGAALATPNLQDISHVSFCYMPGFGTTAASASVSGSVIGISGRGVARSLVTIKNLNTQETRTVITNWTGRYRFNHLPVGDFYEVTISNKKAGFNRQTQSLVLNNDEENLNFIATAY